MNSGMDDCSIGFYVDLCRNLLGVGMIKNNAAAVSHGISSTSISISLTFSNICFVSDFFPLFLLPLRPPFEDPGMVMLFLVVC